MVEVTATLIQAAVKGFIRIEQTGEKGLLNKAGAITVPGRNAVPFPEDLYEYRECPALVKWREIADEPRPKALRRRKLERAPSNVCVAPLSSVPRFPC